MRSNGRVLKPDGWFAIEIGYDQSKSVEALMRAAGAQRVRTVRDLSNRDRVVTGVKNILGKAAAIALVSPPNKSAFRRKRLFKPNRL